MRSIVVHQARNAQVGWIYGTCGAYSKSGSRTSGFPLRVFGRAMSATRPSRRYIHVSCYYSTSGSGHCRGRYLAMTNADRIGAEDFG